MKTPSKTWEKTWCEVTPSDQPNLTNQVVEEDLKPQDVSSARLRQLVKIALINNIYLAEELKRRFGNGENYMGCYRLIFRIQIFTIKKKEEKKRDHCVTVVHWF